MRSELIGRIGTIVVCLLGAILCAVLMFYAGFSWVDYNVFRFLGLRWNITSSILSLSGLYVIVGLIRGRRWAWWSAFAVALVTISAALFFLNATIHPRDVFEETEMGTGFFVSLVLLVPGVLSAILLVLPAVRKRFQ